MIWLTWRQYRIEMLIIGVVLLLITTVLVISGLSMAANQITGSAAFYGVGILLPLVLPVLAGMFIGGPAIAREFEQGTYRLMWTQGIPWYRWLQTRVALLSLIVVSSFGILFGILSWWSFSRATVLEQIDFSNHFDGWGIVTIAYALFAVMLGIFSGVVTRKTVAAIVLTLVLFVTVRVVIVNFARPSYLPPVVVTTPMNIGATIPDHAWIISTETVNRQGQPISIEESQVCNPLLPQNPTGVGADTQYNSCVLARGLQIKMLYQPPDRYWLLQGIESGIYLLLTALLFALTVWWTKRRIIGL